MQRGTSDVWYGFTLAEVLITLGVIGVIASMTLPTVINKIQDKQYKTAYKKAYSSLSQAFVRMQAADEYLDMSDGFYEAEAAFRTYNISENFKIISKYFKATKKCFNNNADMCWACTDGEAGYIYGGAPNWHGCSKESYAFVDASGMTWYLYSNKEWPVLVDVNGKKKPNKLGKDRFVLKFASHLDKNAAYIQNADSIAPWEDIINKGRWCPSGNCLYKSWLFD